MINLRFRPLGQEEWTYADLAGEQEDGIESLLVAALLAQEFQVQKCNEDGEYEEWEDFSDE